MNEALFAGLGAFVTAVMGAIGLLWKQWYDQQRTTEKDALAEYKELVQKLKEEVATIKGELDALRADYIQCQIEVAELYGWLATMHGLATRQASEIAQRGGNPEVVPDLPPRRHPRAVATVAMHADAASSVPSTPSRGGGM